MKLVAVTSCPTGIAHSQMAAENIETTAESLGHEIKVEVQGAMGAENELTAEDVAAADAAIIAADTSVSQDRFADLPLVKGSVKDGVNDAEGLIERAAEAAGETASAVDDGGGKQNATAASSQDDTGDESADVAGSDRERTDTNGNTEQRGLLTRIRQMFS